MRQFLALFLIIATGATAYVAVTGLVTTALIFTITLAISMALSVTYALLDDRRWAFVRVAKLGLVALLLPSLVGCGGSPITATSPEGRASTTYSLDMEIVDGCSVRTYRESGIDARGREYLRMGRVFWYPQDLEMLYLPNFSWFTGAVTGVSGGNLDVISEGARIVFFVLKNGRWIATERVAPHQFQNLIVDEELKSAVEKTAVTLQTGDTRIANCKDVEWR